MNNMNNKNYISFIILIILVIIIKIILKYFNKIENFTTTIYTTSPVTSAKTLYNLTCQKCPNCPSGKKRINCLGFSKGKCIGCTNTCPTGKYRSNCIGISSGDNIVDMDISCMPCPDCPSRQYRDGCSNTSEGTCQPCLNNCPIGQYKSGCSGTSQGNCIYCDANYNAKYFEPSYILSSFIKKKKIGNNYYSIIFENDGNNQSSYTINFPYNTNCDILIVGGGGGGGKAKSGGGAGACIVYKDFNMNGKYTIKVGRGGKKKTSFPMVENGFDSEIIDDSNILFQAKGGGNGSWNPDGGGCGGGAYGTIYEASVCTSQPWCKTIREGGKAIKNNVLSTLINGTPTGNTNDKTKYIVYGSNGGNITELPYRPGYSQSAGGGGIGGYGYQLGLGGNGRYNFTINEVTYTFIEYFGITGDEVFGWGHYIGGGGGGGNIIAYDEDLFYSGGLGGGGNGGSHYSHGNDGYSYGAGGGGGGRGAWEGADGGKGSGGVIVIKYQRRC